MDDRTGAGINVLLVHGAFVDASSWSNVIPLLQKQEYRVLAVQNPATSFADDIQTTRQALASLSGPTILVGHSYGGAVISNVGVGASNVVALVYIAAYAPDEKETIFDLNGKFPATPVVAHFVPAYLPGFVWIDPAAFPENFVQDIPEIEAQVLAVAQKPIALACFSVPSGVPAWKQVPSWYLVSSNDRTLHPEAERFMAKRIGATVREIPANHASPVSHPQEVFELIEAASEGVR